MADNTIDNTTNPTNPNDDRPVVLKVDHVAKYFRLPTEQATGLKMAFLNWTKGIKGFTEQHVLKDISFEVRQGDFFGIVGRNGSGKSTLLKIISQIYVPEKGSVSVKGKLVPFIELGVGFNPELTGRENVYLNAAILGMQRREIEERYDEIVAFSEIEEFIDQEVKHYSSGMFMRLAFSVAIHVEVDVLLVDEILSVGDAPFREKCRLKFEELIAQRKTLLIVSHDLDMVRELCTRGVVLSRGDVVYDGPIEGAIARVDA